VSQIVQIEMKLKKKELRAANAKQKNCEVKANALEHSRQKPQQVCEV